MGEADVPPVEVVDLLWAWNPLFQEAPALDNGPENVAEADDALERLAAGEPAVFSSLGAGALGVLKARHSIAVASATYRIVDGDRDPVMRLPHGLTPDERRLAVTVRLLFQADTAI